MPLDQNPWDDLDTPADGSTPKLDINAKEGRLLATSPINGGRGFGVTEIPVKAHLALDYGWIMRGLEQFQPRYRSHFAPLGSPLPQLPEHEIWTPSTRIQAWVDGFGGLRILRVRGKIHLNRFKTLYQLFGYRPEAQNNKIGIYRYDGFEDISTDFGVYRGILLELVDFTDRDEGLFGPRITPPPPPILTADPRPVMLPTAEAAPDVLTERANTDPTEASAAQPEHTPFSAFRPIQPTTSSEAAPSPQSASRKAGTRKPY
jgi:hypothetical protein